MVMDRKLGALIDQLSLWRAGDDGFPDSPSLRERAIAELRAMGPDVVPVLDERLSELLTATAEHRERVAAVQAAWTAWYDESDVLHDVHGIGVDLEPYRTIPSDSLPQRAPRDENFRDPYELKQGIIAALHAIGDQRAAPVLVAALADAACVPDAARALRDVHAGRPVPELLHAVTLVDHKVNKSSGFDPLLAALQQYGVTLAQAREHFDSETSPLGRVRLRYLMTQLPDDGTDRPTEAQIRDALAFLAMDSTAYGDRWDAIAALDRIENRTARSFEDRTAERGVLGQDEVPPAEIVRTAIAVAAQGQPVGHDRELVRRLRRIRNSGSALRAVEAVLAQQTPEPDSRELRLALRLVLDAKASVVDDPMALIRTLHRLTSHPQVGEDALHALRRTCWGLLFPQLDQEDAARREEARSVFEAFAGPQEHARLARYRAGQPLWARVRRRFGRR